MRIENLFEKDIFRPINGVVKADQLDDMSVWQELDEFVLTRESVDYLHEFIDAIVAVIDNPDKPEITDQIGVWLSGFFGSGKSHLLKIISYLFQNREVSHDGPTRKAIDFFETKVKDALLLADIKRAVGVNTDVILLNIDVKAESSAGREALLRVFLKVLNEAQGFCPEHPHIAHMERHLQSNINASRRVQRGAVEYCSTW
ncbi:MAG TPA: BREX system P-loop protein BrxC, partial [Verrucomicrobiales bacterium]|nr:BREX system P-loop protein BrxC [Verrucomicrobiales bacterium]